MPIHFFGPKETLEAARDYIKEIVPCCAELDTDRERNEVYLKASDFWFKSRVDREKELAPVAKKFPELTMIGCLYYDECDDDYVLISTKGSSDMVGISTSYDRRPFHKIYSLIGPRGMKVLEDIRFPENYIPGALLKYHEFVVDFAPIPDNFEEELDKRLLAKEVVGTIKVPITYNGYTIQIPAIKMETGEVAIATEPYRPISSFRCITGNESDGFVIRDPVLKDRVISPCKPPVPLKEIRIKYCVNYYGYSDDDDLFIRAKKHWHFFFEFSKILYANIGKPFSKKKITKAQLEAISNLARDVFCFPYEKEDFLKLCCSESVLCALAYYLLCAYDAVETLPDQAFHECFEKHTWKLKKDGLPYKMQTFVLPIIYGNSYCYAGLRSTNFIDANTLSFFFSFDVYLSSLTKSVARLS